MKFGKLPHCHCATLANIYQTEPNAYSSCHNSGSAHGNYNRATASCLGDCYLHSRQYGDLSMGFPPPSTNHFYKTHIASPAEQSDTFSESYCHHWVWRCTHHGLSSQRATLTHELYNTYSSKMSCVFYSHIRDIFSVPIFREYSSFKLERVKGIEPSHLPWQGSRLPLHHTRRNWCQIVELNHCIRLMRATGFRYIKLAL